MRVWGAGVANSDQTCVSDGKLFSDTGVSLPRPYAYAHGGCFGETPLQFGIHWGFAGEIISLSRGIVARESKVRRCMRDRARNLLPEPQHRRARDGIFDC